MLNELSGSGLRILSTRHSALDIVRNLDSTNAIAK